MSSCQDKKQASFATSSILICIFLSLLAATATAQPLLVVELSSNNNETQLSFTLPSTSLDKLDITYTPVFRIDNNQVVDVSIYSRLLGLHTINSRSFTVIVSRGNNSTLLTELIEGKTLTIRYRLVGESHSRESTFDIQEIVKDWANSNKSLDQEQK